MARLRSDKTGVIVSVSEETASRLGSDWKPFSTALPVVADLVVPARRGPGRPKKQ